MLPLMHMHGSRANFISSLAKLSSLTGCYSVLYSPSLPPPLFTGIYPDCAHKFTDVFVMQAPYLCLKIGLITKKYSFSFTSKAGDCITIRVIQIHTSVTHGAFAGASMHRQTAPVTVRLSVAHTRASKALWQLCSALRAQPSPGCRAAAYLSAFWNCRSFAARPLH